MAVASLFGGENTPGGEVFAALPDATKSLLDAILSDMIDSDPNDLNPDLTTYGLFGSNLDEPTGVLITGKAADGLVQGAVIGKAGEAVVGEIVDGNLKMAIQLPNGTSMIFKGPERDLGQTEAEAFMVAQVRKLLPPPVPGATEDPAVTALRHSLELSVKALTHSLVVDSGVASVRFVAFTDDEISPGLTRATGPNDVVFKAENTGGTSELLTFFAQNLGTNKTLVLQEVQTALILGEATVRIDGASAGFLAGDTRNQNLTGGSGNDTLVGGGGNDTITGGLGNDVFGITALGHLTITDFDIAHDKLAFSIPGVNNVADLAPFFTALTVESGASTLHFGDNVSVTLVGVSPEQLTLDLLKFTF